jgi:hypothetical protein
VDVDDIEKFQQFGVTNFHARRGGGVKLTLAIKNKWSAGWTKAWLNCKVPVHVCSQGGKGVHVLLSHMCGMDFCTEPPFDCADDDSGDVAFIRATKFIEGQDAIEEFLPCGVYPLAANVNFDRVATSVIPVSKLKMPLPKFVAAHKYDEDDVQFLVRIELDAKGIMGSYTRVEHDTCIIGLCNGGHLNRVFKLVGGGVAYRSRAVPGSDAFTEASKKRKAVAAGKASIKHLRASG